MANADSILVRDAYGNRRQMPATRRTHRYIQQLRRRFQDAFNFSVMTFTVDQVVAVWGFFTYDFIIEPLLATLGFVYLMRMSRIIFLVLTNLNRPYDDQVDIRNIIARSLLPTNIPYGLLSQNLRSPLHNPLNVRGRYATLELAFVYAQSAIEESFYFLTRFRERNRNNPTFRDVWPYIMDPERSYTTDLEAHIPTTGPQRYNEVYGILTNRQMQNHLNRNQLFLISVSAVSSSTPITKLSPMQDFHPFLRDQAHRGGSQPEFNLIQFRELRLLSKSGIQLIRGTLPPLPEETMKASFIFPS